MAYKDILARPIPWGGAPSREDGTLLGGGLNPAADAFYDGEIAKRLEALFRHFGLQPQLKPDLGPHQINVWNLMIALAFEHVPGFALADRPQEPAPKKPRGRPAGRTKAGAPSYMGVFRDVEAVRLKESLDIKDACARVKTLHAKKYRGQSTQAIRSRYYVVAKALGLTAPDIAAATKDSIRRIVVLGKS